MVVLASSLTPFDLFEKRVRAAACYEVVIAARWRCFVSGGSCREDVALSLLLLLLGKRVLDFSRGHHKFNAIRFLFEHADRDHDHTRWDIKESAQLGPHRWLAFGCPDLRNVPEFLAVRTVDGQSNQRWLNLCSGRLGLLCKACSSHKFHGEQPCGQT
jgi:hypothetical protein